MYQENDRMEQLAYEITWQRYRMEKDKGDSLFTELSVTEYVALHRIVRIAPTSGTDPERTYLKDLAESLEMPIYAASEMARKLKERGLVQWMHDGIGDEGTYVKVTEPGKHAMEKQEQILKDYYSRVEETFGYEKLVSLMGQIGELETVMQDTVSKKGAQRDE